MGDPDLEHAHIILSVMVIHGAAAESSTGLI